MDELSGASELQKQGENCASCDTELAETARFCPSCGQSRAPIEAEAVSASESDPGDGQLTVADILAPAASIDASPGTETAPQVGDDEPAAQTSPGLVSDTHTEFDTPEAATSEEGEAVGAAAPAPAYADTSALRAGPGRRIALVGAAVVVIFVAGFVMFGRDSGPSYDLDSALTASNRHVQRVFDAAGRAGTLEQLDAVGKDADAAEAQLRKTRTEIEVVGNSGDRAAAAAVIDAYLASLEPLAQMHGLDAEEAADWTAVGDDVEKHIGAVRDATAGLADRKLPVPVELVAIMKSSAGKVGVALKGIKVKLSDWAAEAKRVTSERDTQRSALDSYAAAFRAQIDKYAGLRNELNSFTEGLLTQGGQYSDAYSSLGGAVTGRQEVHSAMSAAQPPPALVPAHTTIIGAVSDSIAAVQSAVRGLEQHQFSSYRTIESTPGWSEFSRRSKQISDTYNAAVSNWDLAITAERQRLEAIKTPARPVV
ncbi:MAG: hypothetical protein JWM93_3550 [Frankiales bacterium]|nr:hypothetical protein [Frankiales bacterium]